MRVTLVWSVAAILLACVGIVAAASGQQPMEAKAGAPRLYRVIVPVSDIDRAAKFYGELLGIEGKRVSGGRHYLDCGGVILALFQPAADGDETTARPLPEHIYFAVSDLEV